jgi:hypothetical protein
MRTWLILIVLAGSIATIAWQRKALAAARAEYHSWQAAKEESDRLTAETQELAALRAAAQTPPAANSELLRLRNEARQLRALAQELQRLRTENEQLSNQAQAASAPLSAHAGYLAKENWKDAGLATPEETLQTFFRAVRDQDVPRLLQCLSEEGGRRMDIRLDSKTGQLPPRSQETLQLFHLLQGFRVVQRTELAPTEVMLGVQAVTGGEILRLKLAKQGEEWKITGN